MLRGRERLAGDADRVADRLLMPVRGRFAPSPTGQLHLGNARTALLAWLDARSAGGAFVMRVEDLDRARVQPDAEARQLDELAWLGLDWDEGPDRGGPVRALPPERAHRALRRRDRTAARRERGRSSAPARAPTSPAPPARRTTTPRRSRAIPGPAATPTPPPSSRARRRRGGRRPCGSPGGGERIDFVDEVHGPVASEPDGVDDFVLRRADGTAAYQLAVVVDDAAMEVTRVVRGDDLLALDAAADRALPRARARRRRPSRTCRWWSPPAASGWRSGRARRRSPRSASGAWRPRPSSARWPPRRASCARPAAAGRRAGRRILAGGHRARAGGGRASP